MEMPVPKKEIIPVKRVKKDGSLGRDIVERVVRELKGGKIVVMPVDAVFGILAVASETSEKKIHTAFGAGTGEVVRLISSFRMLDKIAHYDKNEFDFLHRVWPGEVVVRLRSRAKSPMVVPVRYPKNKFILDIITQVREPLFFGAGLHFRKSRPFHVEDIFNKYAKANMIVLIEEFCKRHPFPTVVDVANGDLQILKEGRISAEEIKSLYFL